MSSSTVQSTATTTAPGGGGRAGRGGHGTREPLSWLERIRAVVGYFLTVYRRTWRGGIVSSVVQPLLYVVAMGLLLGQYVGGGDRLGGAASYLVFIAPGLAATQSMMIAFGEAEELITQALRLQHPEFLTIASCATLSQAVLVAAGLAQPGDVVLLSPGGTSFDAYKDFAARGEHFRTLVNGL